MIIMQMLKQCSMHISKWLFISILTLWSFQMWFWNDAVLFCWPVSRIFPMCAKSILKTIFITYFNSCKMYRLLHVNVNVLVMAMIQPFTACNRKLYKSTFSSLCVRACVCEWNVIQMVHGYLCMVKICQRMHVYTVNYAVTTPIKWLNNSNRFSSSNIENFCVQLQNNCFFFIHSLFHNFAIKMEHPEWLLLSAF